MFRKVWRYVQKMKKMFFQLEEVYYLESRNYQMLSQLSCKTDVKKYDLNYEWCKDNPRICHALGEIDGILFTESVEAFKENYKNGSRVFELDFNLTSDNEPVVLHDWNSFEYGKLEKSCINNFQQDFRMSYSAFQDVRIRGKYTTITLPRFTALMKEFPDAYFIVSVKTVDLVYNNEAKRIYQRIFEECDRVDRDLKKRLILHAYSLEFFDLCMKEYPFESAIYRLHHCIHPAVLCSELERRGLTTTTTMGGWYPSDEYLKILYQGGIKIIWCAVKQYSRERENEQKKKGVGMVMTPYKERKMSDE
ncbi:MAG: hypothetical protein LUH14_13215 [Clostridiaceae bacterium]|nr:hypothetical protein [Clostridiaceae bacterium]